MISDSLFQQLRDLTKETELEASVRKLLLNYIEARLNYCKLLDKTMREKKGMSFEEYEETKSEEWDGKDWSKIEEFHDWEGAIAGIEFYEDFKEKWTLNNSNKNLLAH
jgi:hypothetical protein